MMYFSVFLIGAGARRTFARSVDFLANTGTRLRAGIETTNLRAHFRRFHKLNAPHGGYDGAMPELRYDGICGAAGICDGHLMAIEENGVGFLPVLADTGLDNAAAYTNRGYRRCGEDGLILRQCSADKNGRRLWFASSAILPVEVFGL